MYRRKLTQVGILLLGVVLACGAGERIAGAPGGARDDMAETLLKGIEHRLSAATSLQGRVLFHYILSESYAEQMQKRHEADAAGFGQTAPQQLEPLEKHHADLVDFEYDESRWRWEAVQLTNTGQDWTGFLRTPAEWRSLEPAAFYRISVCDGETVYTYDRSLNWGTARPYAEERKPYDLGVIGSLVVATLDQAVLLAVREYGFEAIHRGTVTYENAPCHRLDIRSTGEFKRLTRAWIAPSLGYAVLRYENLYFASGGLAKAHVVRSRDLKELLPGVWCPRYVQRDHFRYEQTEAVTHWAYTHIVEVRSLEANQPLIGVVTPYQFPFDARVEDDSVHPPEVRFSASDVARRKSELLSLGAAPDPWGATLTTEKGLQVLRGEGG